MTKEKSKLKKEADKPDLKPLKKIKKHKADKPPKPHSTNPEILDSGSIQTTKKKKKHKSAEPKSLKPQKLDIETRDFDSVQTTKKKKKKKHMSDEPNSLNPEKLDSKSPVSDSVQTTNKKKKHKSGEPNSLNPEKLDIETPDFDAVQTTKKKKKHKSDEPKSLNPEKLDSEAPDSDLVQSRKKKKHKVDKPPETQSLSPEKIDSNIPDSDPIQTTKKKKKKQKSEKPQFINPEEVDSTLEPDSIQILKKKEKKQKSDGPHSPRPEKFESKSLDSDSVRTLEKKKKKKKQKTEEPQKPLSLEPKNFECEINADSVRTRKKKRKSDKSHPLNPEILDSEIDTVSIQTPKKKRKQKLDKPQSPNPKIHDSQIETDLIITPKRKKQKLDEPHPLNPEILDSEIDPGSIQTRKKKRKHDLDKPQSPNPELLDSQIETDLIRTLEEKKQKVDECQKPQSVNPEILASEIDTDSIQNLLKPYTKDQLIEFLLDSAVKTPSILSKIIETADQYISHRKIFVHNLDWDTTRDSVVSVFEQFGELEACDVVYDCVTGKTKGFGFVIYKSRECAKNALKEPKKRIKNRIVSCQWASIGKHDLDKPESPNPELLVSQIETDSNRTLEKKKQKVYECQKPQSVNPEILASEIDTDSIQNLLEPHTKDQLIEFLLDSAVKTPSILSKIVETADQDISHRKIFVHNLDWDTTRDSVVSVFEQFGELEACDVVYDCVTGKTKGFGFVIYKSRECAKNALKEPKKRIKNRIVSCQWASIWKHDLDKPESPNPELLDSQIETDSNRTLEKKKQKVYECQKPQFVNPVILDSEIDTDSIQNLLEPHTKDQLIEFLLNSAVKTPSILSKIVETADQDISHRKIFVHNLDWDTTRDSVVSVFEQFGELEACDVVYDRVTGKSKGFGFVIYKSRECAKDALKEPKKRVNNRIVSCQWASIGPPVVGSVDNSSRKIYVSNVEKDVDAGKLHEFFEKFGEIEVGPLGFDMQTGKSKGYALFVYKNLEGVRKVLEEPNKIFDGKQLNCRMANDWNGRKKNSKSDSSVTTVLMPVPHDLSAVLPKQNMAMLGQQAGFNPMLGPLSSNSIPEEFYANPSAGLFNQLLSQAAEGLYANPSAGLLNQLLSQAGIGANQFGQMGVGLGGYGEAMTGQGMGSLAWNQSGLGSFSGSTSAPKFQNWQHAYWDT